MIQPSRETSGTSSRGGYAVTAGASLGAVARPSRGTEFRAAQASVSTGGYFFFPGFELPTATDATHVELEEAQAFAKRDEIAITEQALRSARAVIKHWAPYFPGPPSIYPDEEGGIAFDLRSKHRRAGLLIICRADGMITVVTNVEGRAGRQTYSSAHDEPDIFLLKAVESLLSPWRTRPHYRP